MKIEYRYEYYSAKGKTFTSWINKCEVDSREEANKLIKTFPKVFNKLKYEYRIVE